LQQKDPRNELDKEAGEACFTEAFLKMRSTFPLFMLFEDENMASAQTVIIHSFTKNMACRLRQKSEKSSNVNWFYWIINTPVVSGRATAGEIW
jgi:hypothetical protein